MVKKITMGVCVALAGTATAWAQTATGNSATEPSTVTLYGVIDQAVEYVSNVSLGNGQTGGISRVTGGATTAARWGLRGREDLGGGLAALFTLESGFSGDTGVLGTAGRLFGRQAYVGLKGSFGEVDLGRLYTMRYYSLLDADMFGGGGHGLGTLDPGIPAARADNSISYRNTTGPFSYGVHLSLGRDSVTASPGTNCPGEASDSMQCRQWSVMAKYDGGSWGVVSSYDKMYGGTAATTAGLTSPELTDVRSTINGYMKLGDNRVGMGWLKRNNEGSTATPKSDLYWVVGVVPVTAALVVDGMLSELKYENSPNKAVMYSLRGTYSLSKRTAVFVSGVHIKNSGASAISASTAQSGSSPLAGQSQNAIQTGIRHSF
jgi:predicted porin